MPQQSVRCHCVRLLGATTVQKDATPSYMYKMAPTKMRGPPTSHLSND